MGRMSRLGNDLYQGRKSVDFVGKPWLFYLISLVLVGLAVTVLFLKPLNMGVEFTGGTTMNVPVGSGNATQDNADKLRDEIGNAGIANAASPTVTTEGDSALTLTTEDLDSKETDQVQSVVTQLFPDVDENQISVQDIGPSWGAQVAKRALLGIAIFLVLVVLFIWGYFREWRMSVAAFVALVHDVSLTVGVYALSGFQVTPAAVTGLLAILGFSLYDTVVVFDKIKENTHQLRKSTQSYGDAANLAVNQTLVRSINTSIVALIPIGAILYVSAVQLGASSLQDLALAQFVGMGVGVYSSVMLAPRVLVHLKNQEDEIQAMERRARARQRAQADRYASVPAVKEDAPATRGGLDFAEPGDPEELAEYDEYDGEEGAPDGPPRPTRSASTEALGKGRVAPAANRPVSESRSSGRSQPTRQTRSKRGKK